jgi:ABC-2 type transport system ATP-binding protein
VAGHDAASIAVREQLGYMPQQYALYGDLSVDENLTFFGRLFGLPRAEISRRKDRLLAITRLAPFRARRAEKLSGGMYKKLALACALLHQPVALVLDEPSNGVDPVSRRELWELIYEFVSDGMAVLLSTPDMDEAARCHRVGLLHHGAMLAEGPPDTLVARFVHETVTLRASSRTGSVPVPGTGTARDRLEDLLTPRPEVLALSPDGAALRLVLRQGTTKSLLTWAEAETGHVSWERVEPSFEDVFLGLLADPDACGAGSPEAAT